MRNPAFLQHRLSPTSARLIEIRSWGNENTRNSGYTFVIQTEEQFNLFLEAVAEKTE